MQFVRTRHIKRIFNVWSQYSHSHKAFIAYLGFICNVTPLTADMLCRCEDDTELNIKKNRWRSCELDFTLVMTEILDNSYPLGLSISHCSGVWIYLHLHVEQEKGLSLTVNIPTWVDAPPFFVLCNNRGTTSLLNIVGFLAWENGQCPKFQSLYR